MTSRIASSICVLLLLVAGAASADTLTTVPAGGTLLPAQGWFSTGSGQTPTTVTGTGVNNGGGVTVNNLTGAGAGAFLFSQSLTAPNGSFAAPNQINGAGYGFITSYVIDVPPAMANAFVFSLNLSSTVGLQDLSARLYEYSANGITNLTLGTAGPLSSGSVDTWSASVNPTGTNPVASTALPTTHLNNGGERDVRTGYTGTNRCVHVNGKARTGQDDVGAGNSLRWCCLFKILHCDMCCLRRIRILQRQIFLEIATDAPFSKVPCHARRCRT